MTIREFSLVYRQYERQKNDDLIDNKFKFNKDSYINKEEKQVSVESSRTFSNKSH